MEKLFASIAVLKDGTNFSAHMSKIKFKALKAAGDPAIAHLAQTYKTADKRFATAISQKFGPRDEDWTLNIDKLTGSEFLQAKSSDGKMIMCDSAALSSGAGSKLVCKAGETVTIDFPVKPSMVKWIGSMRARFDENQEAL